MHPKLSDLVSNQNNESVSFLVSRNVCINGHRTSIRLEPDMWAALKDICKREKTNPHQLCSTVANTLHNKQPVTSSIRVFIMNYYRLAATDEGHAKAGHGKGLLQAIDQIKIQNIEMLQDLKSLPAELKLLVFDELLALAKKNRLLGP